MGRAGAVLLRAASGVQVAALSRLIPIGRFATRSDAEVAQGLLAAAGIDASVSSDDAGGAYPFDLSGGAQLLVDEDDVEAASGLLKGVGRS
jgi:hypothetical protein